MWEVHEKSEDQDGAKAWAVYVVRKGEQPKPNSRPFAGGHWFFGKEGGDPAGKGFYDEGVSNAKAEADRLTKLGTPPRR